MIYQFNETVLGYPLIFKANGKCFSAKKIDKGTLAMLSAAQIQSGQKILDLGCGYGVIGIVAAKIVGQENVVMSDIDTNALAFARENTHLNNVPGVKVLQSDGFDNISETGFDVILSNPPYHADFKVPKIFIEKGFNRLRLGGSMLMVTKREEWYKQKFIGIFGGVKIYREGGYFVFCAEKRSFRYGDGKHGGS